MRRKLCIFLTCMMIFTLICPAWAAGYNDTAGHWAEKDIIKMSAVGLIKGYADGRFGPDKDVTRQEVVTLLVRLINKDAEVMALQPEDLTVKSTARNAADWALPYLEVAKMSGIVTDAEMQTLSWNWVAERQEVLYWMAKAIKLSPVSADSEGVLEQFLDVKDINAAKSLYIVPLVKDGIVKGNSGNLNPLDPVKRSEIAALLSRADAKYLGETVGRSQKGQIIGLNADGKIMVKNRAGLVDTIDIETGAILYDQEGNHTIKADLKVGQWLEVVENADEKAIYAEVIKEEALPAPTTLLVRGTINSIINASVPQITVIDEKGSLGLYNMGPDTIITVRGVKTGIMSLQPGQTVTLELVNGTVKTVSAVPVGTTLEGELISLDQWAGVLEIESNSTTYRYWLSPNLLTQITKTGSRDFVAGDRVRINVNNGLVDELHLLRENGDNSSDDEESAYTIYTGTLYDIDIQEDEIELKSGSVKYLDDSRWRNQSGSLTLEVDSRGDIYYNDDEVDFDDLDEYDGKTVYVAYDEDEDKVVRIYILKGSQYLYDDEICDVDTRSETFELDDAGKTVSYDDCTIVIKDGKLQDGDDLEEDDTVYVVADRNISNYLAAVVYVEERNSSSSDENVTVYKGTLNDVDTEEDEIELKSGSVKYLDEDRWRDKSGSLTLEVDSRADIYYDGDDVDFDDLDEHEGEPVYVAYDGDEDEVVRIYVQKGSEYNYDDEISDVDTRNETFELDDANRTISYDESAIVIKDNKLQEADDLDEGDEVYAVIDRNGSSYGAAVVYVKDTGSSDAEITIYKGTLDDVDTGNDEIELKSSSVEYLDGSRWRDKSGSLTLEVDSRADIYYNGDEVDFDELDDYDGKTIYAVYDEDEDEVVKIFILRGYESVYDDAISDMNTRNEMFELDEIGKTISYDDSTIFIEDGELIDGDDLDEEDEVYVTVDRNGSSYRAAVVYVK